MKKFDKISSLVIGINDIKQLKEIIKFLKEETIDISYNNYLKYNDIIDPSNNPYETNADFSCNIRK